MQQCIAASTDEFRTVALVAQRFIAFVQMLQSNSACASNARRSLTPGLYMTDTPTTPSRTRRSRSRPRRLTILDHVLEADLTPMQIAQKLGVSMADLADWIADPRNVRIVQGYVRLADLRAQILVSTYRAAATIRLINIAGDTESPELSRRASIDLLRAELPAIGLKSLDDADSAGLTSSARAPSEAAILRTLEELGKLDDANDQAGASA